MSAISIDQVVEPYVRPKALQYLEASSRRKRRVIAPNQQPRSVHVLPGAACK